ncbi:MAG: hypothetical protein Q9162_007410, partial [Coniocarpon cinnabarinum]
TRAGLKKQDTTLEDHDATENQELRESPSTAITCRDSSPTSIATRCCFIFILILFVDSVNRIYRVQLEINLMKGKVGMPTASSKSNISFLHLGLSSTLVVLSSVSTGQQLSSAVQGDAVVTIPTTRESRTEPCNDSLDIFSFVNTNIYIKTATPLLLSNLYHVLDFLTLRLTVVYQFSMLTNVSSSIAEQANYLRDLLDQSEGIDEDISLVRKYEADVVEAES